MGLKEQLENSLVFVVLGFIVASFIAGVGCSVWVLNKTGIKILTQSQYIEISSPIELVANATQRVEIPINPIPYKTRCVLKLKGEARLLRGGSYSLTLKESDSTSPIVSVVRGANKSENDVIKDATVSAVYILEKDQAVTFIGETSQLEGSKGSDVQSTTVNLSINISPIL